MIVTENFRERISNSPLRAMGIEGWRGKTQDRDLWRRIAREDKAHEGL